MLVGDDNNNNIPVDEDYKYDSDIDSGDYEEQINTVDVDNIDEDIEVQEESSELASTPGKNILLFGGMFLVAIYLMYIFVFEQTDEEKKAQKLKEIEKSQPIDNAKEPTQDNEKIEISNNDIVAPDLPEFDEEISSVTKIDEIPTMIDSSGFSEDDDENIFKQWPDFNKKDAEDNKFNPDDFGASKDDGFDPSNLGETPGLLPPSLSVPQGTSGGVPSVAIPSVPSVPVNPITTSARPTTVRAAPVQVNVGGPTAEELAALKAAKIRQPMLVLSGGGTTGKKGAGSQGEKLTDEYLNSDFEMIITAADKAKAAVIGNTDNMIAQGKMIDAVLETAVNTDVEGMLRAIVSRDVYAESGRNVLIPKGSRLIGEYTEPLEGTSRVVIIWSRVIRPDGIDVAIDSPGTDKMGRAGVAGFVDNKFFDIISNAILLSTLSIGTSILVDDITESQAQTNTTTTGSDGSTSQTNTSSTTDAAVLSSVGDIGEIADQIAEGLLDDKPTIVVQQGERIKVFVNRDLHFPKSIAQNIRFVN